ncbi:kinase-like domain-containing protein [Podospora aff. communis PSN243]|uniref:Kinase-like domain-containing protein n=1 Tax=Podospora aff. communis PSN243 TaxID=3040156 RepID=A0AAV9GKR2_9PEZI|nr:kinase-like domain-containing protein [Podospora aff. communis PSN243]
MPPLPENIDQILAAVKSELSGTAFSCEELIPLSGGNANYVFCAKLASPLEGGISQVLIKHGEGYLSGNTSFQLPTSRCAIESKSLASLGGLSPAGDGWFSVRTPKLYHFNPERNTQIQEYLPNGVDLKSYALKHFEPHTSLTKKVQCVELGRALGRWLRHFHEWAGRSSEFRRNAAENTALQRLKHSTYYDYLVQMVDKFPDVLSKERGVFESVKVMSEREIEDDSVLQPVHADFWTGNVLLPDAAIEGPVGTSVFVVDWEVTSLGVRVRDVGQMMAELYMLQLFKQIDAGGWMVEGLLAGYGKLSEDEAFRIAIHVGCHLIVIGGTVPGWGSSEHVDRVVAVGRDMIVNGWARNKGSFEGTVLGNMFL